MTLKGALAASASALAIIAAGAPAVAQDTPIETVIVTGIRASQQRAIDIKRGATAMVDAVSAEDIGRFPDKNVADALQRVPGVTTFSQASGEGGFDENDRVAIRGTNPSLTQTTVDGHSVGTGDWFILDQFQTVGRSVSFALFPSEIVQTLTVYKSQQADLVEGGVAGSVDIRTHRPMDFDAPVTVQASAQMVYSDLPDKYEPQLNAMMSWHNDTSTFGVLAQAFFEKRDLRRDGQEFLGYATATVNGQSVLYPTLIGSALFEQQRQREGGDVTFEYKPNNHFDMAVSTFYSHLDADNFNNNFMAWVSNEFNSGNVPTNAVIKNGTLVAADFPISAPTHPDPMNPLVLLCPNGAAAATTGPACPVNGVVEDSIFRPGAAAETWYIDGDFNWRPTDNWNFHGKIGYTRGKGETPSQPTWESDAVTSMSYDMRRGVAAVSFPDIDTTNPADFHNDWAWSDQFTAVDKEFYAQADSEYDWGSGGLQAVKFGVRYAKHNRDVVGFDRGTCFFACPADPSTLVASGKQYPSDFGDSFSISGFLKNIWLPDTNKIRDLVMPQVTPYTANFFYWPGSFAVEETDWAGYAMANFGGERWKGNVGIRVVDTKEHVSSYVSDATGTPNAYGNFDLVQIDHDYVDPLPSANFSYNLSDDMLLRFAAARVMSRPDYSALGGAVSLNDTIHVGTGGNPDLKPVRAWTYNAAWEWYFGDASLLSVGVFYMDLTSFVTFGTHDATYLDATATGQQGHPIFASYAITSPANTSGTDKGIEVSFQMPIWKGFGVITNYTYADGTEDNGGPLVGDAKHTYNLTGYYENDWLSARLAYTFRSHVLIGLDRSTAENQDDTKSLDASVSVNVTDNIALTFDALNLTDETLSYYANNRTQPRAFYDNGRQFFFGIRAKY